MTGRFAVRTTQAPENDGGLALRSFEGEPPPDWEDALRESGGAVFHGEAWASHKCHDGSGTPIYFAWQDARGRTLRRALGLRRPSPDSFAGRLVARLVFDSPPAGDAQNVDLISPLRDWAKRQHQITDLALGSFDERFSWGSKVPNPVARCEYTLNPASPDAVWGTMRRLARRKVKRATSTGMQCRTGEVKDLPRFAELYELSHKRLERTKGIAPMTSDAAAFSRALALLLERDAARFYVTETSGTLEAGWAFATSGNSSYSIYTGASDSARDSGAAFLTLFHALTELSAEGFTYLNLGGAPADASSDASPDHGLHVFKTRFGATVKDCTSGSLVLRPGRAKLVAGVRRMVRR